MNRAKRIEIFFAIWIVALFTACSGTEVGNPATNDDAIAQLEFTAYAGDPGGLTLASGVTIDEAWIVLNGARFLTSAECVEGQEGEAEVIEEPTFAIELISGREYPSAPLRSMPPGSFCELRLDLTSTETAELPEGADAALSGHSLLVRGHRADGVAFTILMEEDEALELDARMMPFDLEKGEHSLLIGFAIDEWFINFDLSAQPNDELIIDEASQSELLDTFKENFQHSLRLFRDSNNDRILQADERTAPLATSSLP